MINALDHESVNRLLQNTTAEKVKTGQLPIIMGKIDGQEVRILVDTGASRSFISKGLVDLLGLPIKEGRRSTKIISIHGEEKVNHEAIVEVWLPTVHPRSRKYGGQPHVCETMSLLVIELHSYDVILGYDWLCKQGEEKNVSPSEVSYTKWNKKGEPEATVIQIGDRRISQDKFLNNLITFEQVESGYANWLNEKEDQVYICTVREAAEEELTSKRYVPSELEDLKRKYQSLFINGTPTTLPKNRGKYDVEIATMKGSKIPCARMRLLAPKEQDQLNHEVKELLQRGLIEPSKSPYGSQVLFVKKKDGSLRMCVDYRALNRITVEDKFPLPNIQALLKKLQGAKFFSSLDLASGYWQFRIKEKDVHKTSFRTPDGSYQWKVLPFGLTNAPSAFQRNMNSILRKHIKAGFVVVYLDDILVFSRTRKEHKEHLDQIFQTLREHDLYLQEKKCSFFQKEVLFLGQIVAADGIRVNPKKIEAVQEFPVPHNITTLRSFLGLANYYRRFIRDYSAHVCHMSELLKDDVPFIWSEACDREFQNIKLKLTTAPTLRIADPNLPYVVHTDASDVALGAVLMQDFGKGLQPIEFLSKKFGDTQRKYQVFEKEILALVTALREWRHYLLGAKAGVTLYTDNRAVTHLKTLKTPGRKELGWLEILAEYGQGLVISYITGKQNRVADALSRMGERVNTLKTYENGKLIDVMTMNAVDKQRFNENMEADWYKTELCHSIGMSLEDPNAVPFILQNVASQVTPTYEDQMWTKFLREYALTKDEALRSKVLEQHDKINPDQVIFEHGLLRIVQPNKLSQVILAVSQNTSKLRIELITEVHKAFGHVGRDRLLQAMQTFFYWTNMRQDVEDVVRHCEICSKSKNINQKPYGKAQPLPTPKYRWEEVTMDLVSGFPQNEKTKHDSILVFVDRLSKMVRTVPVQKDGLSAQRIVEAFIDTVFKLHGMPKRIITDRASTFTGEFYHAMMDVFGTQLSHTTAFHPQSDGQTERANRSIIDMLRAYCSSNIQDWEKYLPLVEFALNSAVSTSTQLTPFFFNYGRHPVYPFANASQLMVSDREDVNEILLRIQSAIQLAQAHLEEAQRRQKEVIGARRREHDIQVGDKVYMSTKNFRQRLGQGQSKLFSRYIGPVVVTELIGSNAVRLNWETLPSKEEYKYVKRMQPVVNVEWLQKYDHPVPKSTTYPKIKEITDITTDENQNKVYKVKYQESIPREETVSEVDLQLRYGVDEIHEFWKQYSRRVSNQMGENL